MTIAEQVKDKESFVEFLQALSEDLSSNKEGWENLELERYLEAMERFLRDSQDGSANRVDFTPSWNLFAKIMIAASLYE